MKFAHLGDCHLGSWRQPELQELNFLSFEKAIAECIKQNCEFVLVAGDLFDSAKPSEALRAFTFRLLSSFEMPMYIISGNHDSKRGYTIGTSESYLHESIYVIQPKEVLKVDDITLIGYCRDQEEFYSLCEENSNTFLVTHRDIPPFPLPFKYALFGHIHMNYQAYNGISIGSLFRDSWAEENETQGYYCITNKTLNERVVFTDWPIKTFSDFTYPPDGEYKAIRYKMALSVKDFTSVNQEEIRGMYKDTKIFFDLKILEEERDVEQITDVKELVKTFLHDKNLTDKEIEFGTKILNHVRGDS